MKQKKPDTPWFARVQRTTFLLLRAGADFQCRVEHVKSHTAATDIVTCVNRAADKAATEAYGAEVTAEDTNGCRVRLTQGLNEVACVFK